MGEIKPYFAVFWGAREQAFGEFVSQTREFLEGLQKLHPLFASLLVLGDRMSEEKPLGVNLENLEELALERGWDKKVRFPHPDDQGRPTADSKYDLGWGFSIVNEPEAQSTEHRALCSHLNKHG